MKSKIINVFIAVVFVVGVGLLAYPFVGDMLNTRLQSKTIHEYESNVDGLKKEETDAARAEAEKYNQMLLEKGSRWNLTDEEQEWYLKLLNLSGNGIMGYVEIPKINVLLSIGHGTSEEVLENGVGHMEGSSLPVGGMGTHCALSGHRGLPSAKLFTDLDKIEVGDEFYLHVLGESMAYEVDQILVVEPDEMSALAIDTEKDYCTLVTCTPYGVNSHRLLVRGVRKLED